MAWRLLYNVYRTSGYIPANPFELHTVPEAISPDTIVVLARADASPDATPLSTIAGIIDGPRGLPLDSAYPRELAELRRAGHRLVEVGLFGCQDEQSSFLTIFDLMRYVVYHAIHSGANEMICGIPPQRIKLYQRLLGFQHVGAIKTYATVADNPVALMRLSISQIEEQQPTLRAVSYFIHNPLPASTYTNRFRFASDHLIGSPIDLFLQSKGELPIQCAPASKQLRDVAEAQIIAA
ncbi:MAG: hypothetical protein WCI73_17610 [Phycisphaerae bacterium]